MDGSCAMELPSDARNMRPCGTRLAHLGDTAMDLQHSICRTCAVSFCEVSIRGRGCRYRIPRVKSAALNCGAENPRLTVVMCGDDAQKDLCGWTIFCLPDFGDGGSPMQAGEINFADTTPTALLARRHLQRRYKGRAGHFLGRLRSRAAARHRLQQSRAGCRQQRRELGRSRQRRGRRRKRCERRPR